MFSVNNTLTNLFVLGKRCLALAVVSLAHTVMLVPQAHAAGAPAAGGGLMSFLPLILVFVVMYFFFIRTQQKKDKQQKELLGGLKKGDQVVTQSGIIGTLDRLVDDQEVLLEISDGVKVRYMKTLISGVVTKKAPKIVREQAKGVASKGGGKKKSPAEKKGASSK